MAEIFAREKVLLGYSSSPTELSSPRRRSCDVDFSDVFGGPPRRSSNQDERTSFDSRGFDGDEDAGEDEGWLNNKLREKPVFGEAPGVVRRRYTGDDFFDDIFRGEQASSSAQSPRVVGRRSTPFSSAPGSRAMSPSRSLPPADPFATPAKLSLPGRVTSTDFMASTSLNQNLFSPSLSRFNQTTQNLDCGNDSSYQSSAVPRPDSTDGKESTSGSLLHGLSDQSDFNNHSKGSEFPTFHFSIYNWPSSGVPLVISLRKKSSISKQATKLDRCWSSSEKQVRVDALLSEYHTVHTLVTDALSLKKSGSPVKDHKQDDSSVSLRTAEAKSKKDDTAPPDLNYTSVSSSLNVLDKARERVSSGGLEVAKEANNLSGKGSDSVSHKHNKLPKSLLKKTKSNMRPLSSFFNKNNEGNATLINTKMGNQMSMRTEKEAASLNDDVSVPRSNKTKVQEQSPASKSDACESEATGKVKDFVKIFTPELPSKASGPGLRQSHSRRWKDTKNDEVDHEIRFSSARMNDEVEASFVNWEETWPDTSTMDDGNSAGSSQFNMNDIGSGPDTTGQTSANAPNVDSSRESATNTSTFSADDILVNVEAKGHETKVSQWAKGKEGNIRALLSTLQYVLWPESGWKPIPLVDIIEANAVKRAYQKALLRLHPDKLQQKGAAPHHKLIAEDVFDILQEAWDQFNSLGS